MKSLKQKALDLIEEREMLLQSLMSAYIDKVLDRDSILSALLESDAITGRLETKILSGDK